MFMFVRAFARKTVNLKSSGVVRLLAALVQILRDILTKVKHAECHVIAQVMLQYPTFETMESKQSRLSKLGM